MSILPKPRYPKPSTSIQVWAQTAETYEMRRFIVECRSIEELFDLIAAVKMGPPSTGAEIDSLAQQQIQTLMAAETHEHLRALRALPVLNDPRTYVAFISGALAGWIANILTK